MLNLALLTALQRGLSLDLTPFEQLAKHFKITEDEVFSVIKNAFESGLARRLGAVYDAASLGYASTLSAVSVPAFDIDEVVKKLNARDGVTHNYLRDGEINIWFTLTEHETLFDVRKKEIEQICFPYKVYFLPVLEKYKVQVVFDLENGLPLASEAVPQTVRQNLNDFEQRLIALSQTSFPLENRPFLNWARRLNVSESTILETLKKFESTGAMRRLALIVRHQRVGIDENTMATWRINPQDGFVLGKKLAQCAGVSHCYLRDVPTFVGGNLYAMMHGRDATDLQRKIQQAQTFFPTIEPQLFKTLCEFKKTSPFFFKEALLDE